MKEKLLKENTLNFKDQNIKRIEERIQILEKELSQNLEEPQEEDNKIQKDNKIDSKNESLTKTNNEKIIIDTDKKSMTNTISTGISGGQVKKPSGPEYVKDKKLYESLKARLEEFKEASQYFSKIV